jgi:uncharacterized protein
VPVSNPRDLFRLNVGFIIHENVGYSRDFPYEIPSAYLSPDLELHNLAGIIRVSRTPQGLLVQARLRAEISAECVRCLDAFQQPLEIDFTELYAFNRDLVTDLGLLVPENGKLELEQFVREEMILAIPISPLCSLDCKGLCLVCGCDLNETECEHNQQPVDSRLSILKMLLDNNSNSS